MKLRPRCSTKCWVHQRDYQQELSDARALASIGTVDDVYDNALAQSFDSFKTELIADRVWRTRSQLEFAVPRGCGSFSALTERGIRPPTD